MIKILVVDTTIGHVFECETEEGAQCFIEAIEIMNHDYKVIRKEAA